MSGLLKETPSRREKKKNQEYLRKQVENMGVRKGGETCFSKPKREKQVESKSF